MFILVYNFLCVLFIVFFVVYVHRVLFLALVQSVAGETRLRNDVLCVELDVKVCLLIHFCH